MMVIEGLEQLDANDYFEVTIFADRIKVEGGSLVDKVRTATSFSSSLVGCSEEETVKKVIDYYLENARILGIRRNDGNDFTVEGPFKYENSGNFSGKAKRLKVERPLDRETIAKISKKYEFDRENVFLNSLGAFCNYQFRVADDNGSYYRYSKANDTMYFFLSKGFDGMMWQADRHFLDKAVRAIFRDKEATSVWIDKNGDNIYLFDDGSRVSVTKHFTTKASKVYFAEEGKKEDLAILNARQMKITEDGGSK